MTTVTSPKRENESQKRGGLAVFFSESLQQNLLHWLLFSVIIALVPFVIQWLMLLTRGNVPTTVELFSNGELLLVSSAIAASAIGSLVLSDSKYRLSRIVVGWCCVCVLILASAWFAIISIESNTGSFDPDFAANGSILMFIFTVISSAGCIILAELK